MTEPRLGPDPGQQSVREFAWPRERRVRLRSDYVRIQKSRVRVTTKHLVFVLAPGPLPYAFRLGIVASRKIGPAVVRNRAKRLLREVCRRVPGLAPNGIDVVVVVRAPMGEMRMVDVLDECRSVAGLIRRRAAGLCGETPAPHGGKAS